MVSRENSGGSRNGSLRGKSFCGLYVKNSSGREEVAQQRDQDSTNHGDASASHELLHTLRLGTGVIVAITFKQVDDTPDAKARTKRDDQSLENIDRVSEKFQYTFLLSDRVMGIKKRRP